MQTFVETTLFSKLVQKYLTDDEYADLQRALIAYPKAGPVIRGSGGVRKLRWRSTGRGKRGALRVIYYLQSRQGQVWMLTMYAKSETGDISAGVLKRIRGEIDDGR